MTALYRSDFFLGKRLRLEPKYISGLLLPMARDS